jgi:hypothetical protein
MLKWNAKWRAAVRYIRADAMIAAEGGTLMGILTQQSNRAQQPRAHRTRSLHRHALEPDEESSIEIDQVILIPDAELSSVLLEEIIEHLATPNN